MLADRLSRYRSLFGSAVSSPSEALRAVYDLKLRKQVLRLRGSYLEPNRRLHLDYDWDVSVVLDGCRYDMLADTHAFDAECRRHVSQAPATFPWFLTNFVDVSREKTADLVYVSSNPQASLKYADEDRFHHFEEVFSYGWTDDLETVPPDAGTVPADVMTDVALSLHDRYPDTRLLVHYLQPHNPFVQYRGRVPEDVGMAYGALKAGEIDRDTVQQAELANTRYVLDHVERLVDHVGGDVVVTADHGNGWGEDGIYGHPRWAYAKPTLEVPWLELAGGGEPVPDSVAARVRDLQGQSEYDREAQLADLGYR